jgi:hypothetical protein
VADGLVARVGRQHMVLLPRRQPDRDTPPSNTEPPAKAKVHNTGTWVSTSPRTLKITWKQVVGAPKPCEETFWNAVEDCERMDATSNLYSPLVATRFRAK